MYIIGITRLQLIRSTEREPSIDVNFEKKKIGKATEEFLLDRAKDYTFTLLAKLAPDNSIKFNKHLHRSFLF